MLNLVSPRLGVACGKKSGLKEANLHPYIETLLEKQSWSVITHHVTPESVRTISGTLATDFFVVEDEDGARVFMNHAEVERYASISPADARLFGALPFLRD
jgi:hypothetical protein